MPTEATSAGGHAPPGAGLPQGAIDPAIVQKIANEIFHDGGLFPEQPRAEPESAVPKGDSFRGRDAAEEAHGPTPGPSGATGGGGPGGGASTAESGGAGAGPSTPASAPGAGLAEPSFYFLQPLQGQDAPTGKPGQPRAGDARTSDLGLPAEGMGGFGPAATGVPGAPATPSPEVGRTPVGPTPPPGQSASGEPKAEPPRTTPGELPMPPTPPRGRPDLPTSGDPFTMMATRLLEGFPTIPGAAPGVGLAGPRLPSTPDEIGTLLGKGPGAGGERQAAAPRGSDNGGFYFLPGEPPPAVGDSSPSGGVDPHVIRKDFPALHQKVHGKPLIWMDNAATTHKPRQVIDALSRFYEKDYSNIHRGAHTLAARATEAYENAREKIRRFLGAESAEEIVYVRGTTEAINLVAQSWGRQNLGPGDEILLTELEHHANIVPWQMIAREKGAKIRVVPITERGEVMMEEYARLLGPRTKIVGVSQVSNALGTVVPVHEMVQLAHRRNVPVLVDGAQSVPHVRIDLKELGADFFVFSGHKLYGPSGVGVLYGRRDHLQSMPPWQGGGNMIRSVTFDHTTYSEPPAKFEAGTPTIADAVGLGAAIDYVEKIGVENISRYEHGLTDYGMERLREVPGIRLIGTAPGKVSVLSFVFPGTRPEDVGRYLDGEGIAVRSGHHCAQPTMQRYGVTGTVRPSLAIYNTKQEVDCLVEALKRYPKT